MALIDRGRVMTDYLENLGKKDSYKAKYEALVKAVDDAPTIDAEPVRHGRWIEVDRITWRGADDHQIDITVEEKCSNCGRYVERYETVQQENFCPNCGAKMDLKEK